MIVKAILTKCRRINLLLTDSQKRRCVQKAKLLSSHFQAKVGIVVSKLHSSGTTGITEKLWSKFFFKMHTVCSEIQIRCNLGKSHCLRLQKMLILDFEVIVHPPILTLFTYCTIFSLLRHCEIYISF